MFTRPFHTSCRPRHNAVGNVETLMPHPHCILPTVPNTSPLAPAANRPIWFQIANVDSCFVSVLRTPSGKAAEAPGIIEAAIKNYGQPSDIASIAVFLASEDSAWLDDPGMLP